MCPRCRTTHDQWLDEEGKWLEDPLLEPVVVRCPGCHELDRFADVLRKDKQRDGFGESVGLEPFDPDRDLADEDRPLW